MRHAGDRSGFVLAGAKAMARARSLSENGYEGPVLVDPAAYEGHLATAREPFWFPEGQLYPPSLGDALDRQLVAGAVAALTPTKFIRAGDTGSLRSAADAVKRLRRDDVIFVAPLDIALLDRQYFNETKAILIDAGCPVGLVLGGQFDPLGRAPGRIIPQLRELAAATDLMPIRTDFNAFDLVAHGAFAGAIGTGGATRHAVEPPRPAMVFGKDPSPSVLFPELLSWWKGSRIADFFGARSSMAPRCPCQVCEGRSLGRFTRRSDKNEAMAHAVAVWSDYRTDMLSQPTLRSRAQYWKNLCSTALGYHEMIPAQLRLAKPLKPQRPLEVWATLPLWLSDRN